ncbi:MAG: hypothetical protein IT210_00610 [Armatimonadetes bacterium]|nr:hypothetical protein [Armatimonadota bacterium]
MSEPVSDLRDALDRLVVVLNNRLDYYEEEFESLTRQYDVSQCADARRTRHYLSKLQQDISDTENIESMTRAIQTAAVLIHASHFGEPILPRLLNG